MASHIVGELLSFQRKERSLWQKQRKDNKGRVLQKGESQRKLDGIYIYTYVDPYGGYRYVYSKDLFKLRGKEENLMKAQLNVIKKSDIWCGS